MTLSVGKFEDSGLREQPHPANDNTSTQVSRRGDIIGTAFSKRVRTLNTEELQQKTADQIVNMRANGG